jgi:hypothetical protein
VGGRVVKKRQDGTVGEEEGTAKAYLPYNREAVERRTGSQSRARKPPQVGRER